MPHADGVPDTCWLWSCVPAPHTLPVLIGNPPAPPVRTRSTVQSMNARYCEDASVVGAEFYLMVFVKGECCTPIVLSFLHLYARVRLPAPTLPLNVCAPFAPCCVFPPLPSAFCPLPSTFCPLPSALCPLPSTLCPRPLLPFALYPLPSALCLLPSALPPFQAGFSTTRLMMRRHWTVWQVIAANAVTPGTQHGDLGRGPFLDFAGLGRTCLEPARGPALRAAKETKPAWARLGHCSHGLAWCWQAIQKGMIGALAGLHRSVAGPGCMA